MKDRERVSVVYVELDAILDTRLPTLGKINPQLAVMASKDERYYNRVIDDFTEICGVSLQGFRNVYEKRDVEILQAATITEMPFVLNELVLKLERETIDTPHLDRVAVDLNTYPYELDAEEKRILEVAVMHRCGVETVVTAVYIPYEKLTPQYVKQRYSGMFIYNMHDWLRHHVEAFRDFRMPTVTIMAPALYRDEIPADDAFQTDGIREGITAFQLAEVGFTELFSLSLLPARSFSMVIVPPDTTKPLSEVTPEELGERPSVILPV